MQAIGRLYRWLLAISEVEVDLETAPVGKVGQRVGVAQFVRALMEARRLHRGGRLTREAVQDVEAALIDRDRVRPT